MPSSRHITRREFLGRTGGAVLGSTTILQTLLNLGLAGSASAQGGGGEYRALVCLFFAGGIDSFNVLVPRGAAEYAEYAGIRQDLALPQAGLLPITPLNAVGRELGLHPGMPELQALFEQGRCSLRGQRRHAGRADHEGPVRERQRARAARPVLAFRPDPAMAVGHPEPGRLHRLGRPRRRPAAGAQREPPGRHEHLLERKQRLAGGPPGGALLHHPRRQHRPRGLRGHVEPQPHPGRRGGPAACAGLQQPLRKDAGRQHPERH